MMFPLTGGYTLPIHSIHSHLVDRRAHTAKICHLLLLLLRWLELHLLLRLLHAHNHRLRLEGDCSVRLLLSRWHGLMSARAIVVLLLPLLLLNLACHFEVILRIAARSNMRCCVGLVAHALAGAARAVVRLVPSVGPAVHPRLACGVVVVAAAVVVVVVSAAADPATVVVVVVVPAAISVVVVAVVVAVVVVVVAIVVVAAAVDVHRLLLELVDGLLLLL